MSKARTPNHDEGLSAQNSITGQQEYLYSTGHALNVTGTVNTINTVGIFTLPYDEIDASYPNSTTEVYVSKLGGVTVQTVTITYTDTTKNYINTVVRT